MYLLVKVETFSRMNASDKLLFITDRVISRGQIMYSVTFASTFVYVEQGNAVYTVHSLLQIA
jgi:hypothetical protein